MRIEMIYNQVQVINENIKGSGSRILKVFFFCKQLECILSSQETNIGITLLESRSFS
jgi:hypothetical protein